MTNQFTTYKMKLCRDMQKCDSSTNKNHYSYKTTFKKKNIRKLILD